MKKQFAMILGALTLVFAPAASAVNISTLTDGLDTFVNEGTGSLPFAASAGLDWSDAYIGNLLAVPPHFGIGVVAGATTIPGKALKGLVEALGGTLSMDSVPIPLVAFNGRLGGIVLPFDIGLKVGYLPDLTIGSLGVSYQNYGADFRFPLFQGEPLLPDFMVGAGVDYFSTKISATYGSALSFTSTPGTLTVSAPKVSMELSSLTFEAKAQVSKSLLIITPYLGMSALVGSSTANAGVTSTISASGLISDWESYLPGVSAVGFGKKKSVANFGLKIYGGAALNLIVLKLDLQGMYSLLDGSLGGTVGARFQL